MKIFVSHSPKGNYQEELYKPLRESELSKKHELIFPHAAASEPRQGRESEIEVPTKDTIRDCDLVVAEVSNPLFDQGLELGWANGAYVTILCFYKSGSEVSSSVKSVTDSIFEYDSMDIMIKKIAETAEAL
jgi:hypothetical protein